MNPISSWAARRAGPARWLVLYEAAKWIYQHGRRLWDNYEPAERQRMGELLRKSKGRRANLSAAERGELWELVKKAV